MRLLLCWFRAFCGCCELKPWLLHPSINLFFSAPRFFSALATEPAGVRAAVQEATASLAAAFRCPHACLAVLVAGCLLLAAPCAATHLAARVAGCVVGVTLHIHTTPIGGKSTAFTPCTHLLIAAEAHRQRLQRRCSSCWPTRLGSSSLSPFAWRRCRQAGVVMTRVSVPVPVASRLVPLSWAAVPFTSLLVPFRWAAVPFAWRCWCRLVGQRCRLLLCCCRLVGQRCRLLRCWCHLVRQRCRLLPCCCRLVGQRCRLLRRCCCRLVG